MPIVSAERARWLAANILPLEPQLRGWLKRVAPPGLEVDDLVQDAYTKLATLPTVAEIAHPKAYVYQITKRLISEHIRRSTVISIEAMSDVARFSAAQEGFTPERILSGRQELERLYQAIARLPGPCRAVFILRKFDNMPQKMIAAELRISENSVEKRMSRALRMIVDQLQTSESGLQSQPPPAHVQRKSQRGA